jgi:hypothetical protein
MTHTQRQRKASAMIRKAVKNQSNPHLQYYFVRGLFHINNIDGFFTAKDFCEQATNMNFEHRTNSICKLIQQD